MRTLSLLLTLLLLAVSRLAIAGGEPPTAAPAAPAEAAPDKNAPVPAGARSVTPPPKKGGDEKAPATTAPAAPAEAPAKTTAPIMPSGLKAATWGFVRGELVYAPDAPTQYGLATRTWSLTGQFYLERFREDKRFGTFGFALVNGTWAQAYTGLAFRLSKHSAVFGKALPGDFTAGLGAGVEQLGDMRVTTRPVLRTGIFAGYTGRVFDWKAAGEWGLGTGVWYHGHVVAQLPAVEWLKIGGMSRTGLGAGPRLDLLLADGWDAYLYAGFLGVPEEKGRNLMFALSRGF